VLRELLTLGRALEGGDLEAHVLQATGRLYLLDLYPKAREARLVPYGLGPEQCRRFLWVGDPPASNAPRDRATTRKLTYLLGQVPTRLAEDPGLKPLLQGLLLDPGRPGGKARFLLDLRGYRLVGAKDAEAQPFRVRGERLEVAEDLGKWKAGDLAEALAEVLKRAWGVAPPKGGKRSSSAWPWRGGPWRTSPSTGTT